MTTSLGRIIHARRIILEASTMLEMLAQSILETEQVCGVWAAGTEEAEAEYHRVKTVSLGLKSLLTQGEEDSHGA